MSSYGISSLTCKYDKYSVAVYAPSDELPHLNVVPLRSSKWEVEFSDGSSQRYNITLINGFF